MHRELEPNENQLYTAIYEERWQTGSHWHCLTKIRRIVLNVNETVKDMLIREGIDRDIVYLFHGHSRLQGEK